MLRRGSMKYFLLQLRNIALLNSFKKRNS